MGGPGRLSSVHDRHRQAALVPRWLRRGSTGAALSMMLRRPRRHDRIEHVGGGGGRGEPAGLPAIWDSNTHEGGGQQAASLLVALGADVGELLAPGEWES